MVKDAVRIVNTREQAAREQSRQKDYEAAERKRREAARIRDQYVGRIQALIDLVVELAPNAPIPYNGSRIGFHHGLLGKRKRAVWTVYSQPMLRLALDTDGRLWKCYGHDNGLLKLQQKRELVDLQIDVLSEIHSKLSKLNVLLRP